LIIANKKVQITFKEAGELMAIFLKSIETANQNKIDSTFEFFISCFLFYITYLPFKIDTIFSAVEAQNYFFTQQIISS
jgi:hypothetical protein